MGSGDSEARTWTVKHLRSYPHEKPSEGKEMSETPYLEGLQELAIIVGVVGLVLLSIHALYRLCLSFARCCCRKTCYGCVDKARGKGCKYRFLYLFSLAGVVAAVCASAYAEIELTKGVKNVAAALDGISDVLATLQSTVDDMGAATGRISTAAAQIDCGSSADDLVQDFVDAVEQVNNTVEDVHGIFDDMIDPVDTIQNKVDRQGRRYVSYVKFIVAAPVIVHVATGLLGLLFSANPTNSHGSICIRATLASCIYNTGVIWTASVGLPAGVVLVAASLVLSIGISDFCFLGPAEVITADNQDNKYLAYYLRCEGDNPIEVNIVDMSDAVAELREYADEIEDSGVCTQLQDSVQVIEDNLDVLTDSVNAITGDVLTCDAIQPLVGDLFYDALCDKTVNGLYYIWVVLAAAGAATLFGLFMLPCATESLHRAPAEVPGGDEFDQGLELPDKQPVVAQPVTPSGIDLSEKTPVPEP